jgi:hypothetical protein
VTNLRQSSGEPIQSSPPACRHATCSRRFICSSSLASTEMAASYRRQRQRRIARARLTHEIVFTCLDHHAFQPVFRRRQAALPVSFETVRDSVSRRPPVQRQNLGSAGGAGSSPVVGSSSGWCGNESTGTTRDTPEGCSRKRPSGSCKADTTPPTSASPVLPYEESVPSGASKLGRRGSISSVLSGASEGGGSLFKLNAPRALPEVPRL